MSDRHGPGLVGRERELARLQVALEDAIAGRGGLVLLTGEPGIGKTTLAREFVERAADRGAAWAWGSCWDGGGAPAYRPWVQVVRAIVRREDVATLRAALGDSAPWIASIVPELADTLGSTLPPAETNSDQARFRLFEALAGLLAAAAEQRPLVVVLDDLHWADTSSLLALEFIARGLPDIPLLTIAAYRHTEAQARPELGAALGGMARASTRLPLEGLGRDEVAQLASVRARGLEDGEPEPIPPRLVTAVHAASGGNPFFVDELVQLLAAQGRLHDSAAAELPLPLPDGVRDAIRRRLAPLEEGALEALRAAAVIGGTFRLATLASVLGVAAGEVLARLDGPLRAAIVTAAQDRGSFEFGHSLMRDTLLEGLGATRRARLHHRVARSLEDLYGDDPEPHLAEIAYHFLHAASEDGAAEAVDYAARAAQRAVEQFSYEEAARLYERAIEVAATLTADDGRSWLLHERLGEALMRAGDAVAGERELETAAGFARRLDDAERLAQAALASKLGTFSPGVVEPAIVANLEEALARIDGVRQDDPGRQAEVDALRCRLRIQLALALYWSPQRDRREQLVDDALALAREIYSGAPARRSPDQRVLADRTLAFALAQGFLAVWGPESVTRGLPISIEALELCERTSDAELGMQIRLWRISLLLELDDPGRAYDEIDAFGVTARRLGQPRMLVYDPLHRTTVAYLRGDFAAAERFTDEAAQLGQRVRGSIAPIVADAQTFLRCRTQGRYDGLEALVRRNADRLPAMRRWRCGLALVLAELGRVDEARRELDHLAAHDFEDLPRDALWLDATSLLAELCALLGDATRARRLYELMAPYEGRNVVSMGAAYVGPVARYLGLLAMTIGADERALGHLETARSAAQRMGARPTVVLTALDAAEVLARRGAPGDRERGLALVGRVAQDAEQQAMDGAVTRAADLRARLEAAAQRPAPAPQPRPTVASLRREPEVWLLEYDGRTVCLQDVKGMRHLAALLASPGTPIPAVELAARVEGPVLTGTDLSTYRARAAELHDDLLEAQAFNDPERVAALREELEALASRVSGADEARGAAGERARINVTRALRAALGRISEHEPALGRLLHASIRTGMSCVYEPDPGLPLEWRIAD